MDVQQLIDTEVHMYVTCCELAARHEQDEIFYRQIAHALFYHIQEMKSTRQVSFIALSDYPKVSPISHV